MSPWITLFVAGILETCWAIGLKYTEGFTKLGASIFTLSTLAASMYLLAYAAKSLPIGTAYAVWVGIGAALTAGYAMAVGGEPVSALRIAFLLGIVGCVIGLKLSH